MRHGAWQSSMLSLCLCSGLKRPIFTAGNDLAELYAPGTSRHRYKRFWNLSNEFLCNLYRSPLLTVSAIKGACAPAPSARL
jgi:Delta3-Delta2-enoyl-CoA isomerase